MPVAATQPTGKRSKRGRLSEGRPTKCTPELTACIAESISLGLTDQEACAIAGIQPCTLSVWRRNPEFVNALRKATALRLQNRLKTIEARVDNWQAVGWLVERQLPSRFARPEIQLNLIQQNNTTLNSLSITISEKEVKQIESQASLEREAARQMFAAYRTGPADYNDDEKPRIVDVETEMVASKETEPRSDEDAATRDSVRQKFAQYNPATAQPPIVHKEGDEKSHAFWNSFVNGDPRRLVEKRTALLVVRIIVIGTVGPRFAQSIVFESEPISVRSVLRKIEALSGPAGYQLILKKSGYIPHSP